MHAVVDVRDNVLLVVVEDARIAVVEDARLAVAMLVLEVVVERVPLLVDIHVLEMQQQRVVL